MQGELLAHTQALRTLARDLVGESNADDLLQETALQALISPPQRPGPLGGWLASVLRHLASKQRRAAATRRRHEQAAAKPEAVAPSREVEDCDAFRRLSQAVVALPEPYRGTLLARYLRGESPTAIAQRTAVPVRTVQTRLARGLALLRQRFDGEGDDWRAAFAGAFGIGGVAAGVGAGVMVMAMATKLAVGGAAVVLAVAASVLVLPGVLAPTSASRAGTVGGPEAAVAMLPSQQAGAGTTAGSLQRREVLAASPPSEATLRGRCVDAEGVPLANVEARLVGSDGQSRAAIQKHTTTFADGTFAFTLAPPPSFQFQLELRREQHVAQRSMWREIAAGAITDFGDVVLPDGARIQGRVLDTDSHAVGAAQVTLHRLFPEPQSPDFEPLEFWKAATADDGSFAFAAVPPGNFEVDVDDRCIAKGGTFCVGPGLTPMTLAIEVLAKVEGPRITGVVTDENEQPLGGVLVRTDLALRHATRATGGDGRFEIRHREGDPDAAPRLRAECSGFDDWRSSDPVPWSTSDLVIVMRRSSGLELRVTDAATGSPVEDYQVRAWPEQGARYSGLPAPKAVGPHPGGIARLADLPRGFVRLVVEPRDEQLLVSAPQLCEVGNATTRVDVVLQRACTRDLRLQYHDGSAVAGSIVQLADPHGLPLDMASRVLSAADLYCMEAGDPRRRKHADCLQEVITDARGTARLRGPAGAHPALLLRGPGHVPQVLTDVDLDEPAPLVVTVMRGASLDGRVTPIAVLGYLRQYDGHLPARGPVPQPLRHVAPRITLRRLRPVDGVQEDYPLGHVLETRAFVIPEDDGSFHVGGIPPGTWDVLLQEQHLTRLTTVTLRDGEHRRLDLDLGALLPATMRLTVLWNGNAAAAAKVSLRGTSPDQPNSVPRIIAQRTDGSGSIECELLPGTWSLRLIDFQADLGRDVAFRASSTFSVRAGETREALLQVLTGTLLVKVLDASGNPAIGVDLVLIDGNGGHRSHLPVTDADGCLRVVTESDTYTLATLPRCLQSREAQRAFVAQHPAMQDPLASAVLRLGEVTVPVGQTIEREVRLPPEWGR